MLLAIISVAPLPCIVWNSGSGRYASDGGLANITAARVRLEWTRNKTAQCKRRLFMEGP